MMELKLLDLRRYAIDNRLEIKITDSDHQFLINSKGQIKIEGEDKDVRAEDVFASARRFEVTSNNKSQVVSRQEMAEALSKAFKDRGFAAAQPKEEE
jgi:hypothetical protein